MESQDAGLSAQTDNLENLAKSKIFQVSDKTHTRSAPLDAYLTRQIGRIIPHHPGQVKRLCSILRASVGLVFVSATE